jgi:inner membrane transporter RhtA
MSTTTTTLTDRVPPHVYFAASAVFHYLGPSCAVLLFAALEPLGVAWLRIAGAALIFAIWRRPISYLRAAATRERTLIFAMAATLAAMNAVFYLAIARLPLANVGAIEFLGPILLAAWGFKNRRNLVALAVTIPGIAMLTHAHWGAAPLAYLYAFANCALFALYIVLGHRLAERGGNNGIERLAASMLVAAILALPFGLGQAWPAFTDPPLLLAGIGVGLLSSVLPYVCDQLVLAKLPRASFALMLALLPAMAVLIGVLVLGQMPTQREMTGIALVAAGIALHRPESTRS